ncbi:MAG: epsJ 1 [Bacteroidetes bacterium]|nr:epsJ 1 [Bacteroidota bacterium]
MDKISVIIPCYNAERFVAECLFSVLNQTHKNVEVICVDDGSSDNSLSILNDFQQKYPEIIRVISVPNQGASKARNLGLSQTTGDYIQFLDADDVITNEKLEKQLAGFSGNADVVISDRAQKNLDLSHVLETVHFDDILVNPLETAVRKIITTCNPLYKKNMVLELGGYNEQLSSCQDWDFHLRMVLNGYKIAYVPGVFFINRLVPGSISSNWVKVFIQSTVIIKDLKKRLLENPMMNDAIRIHLANIHLNSALYCKSVEDAKKYTAEMVFWGGKTNFLNSKPKQLIAAVFGSDFLIRVLRRSKTKSNY